MSEPTEADRERAREIAQAISELVAMAGYPLGMGIGFNERQVGMLEEKMLEKFASVRAEARREAIDECRKIAMGDVTFEQIGKFQHANIRASIAGSIRDLIEPPAQEKANG